MGKVVASFSMSLDGFIVGPKGDDTGLHNWVFGGAVRVTAGGMTFHLTSEQIALETIGVIDAPGVTHRRFRFTKVD